MSSKKGLNFELCLLQRINCQIITSKNCNVYCYQGHPMDLFLKISVLHANFCCLGDVEEIIVLGRKVLLGKKDNSGCQRGFEV